MVTLSPNTHRYWTLAQALAWVIYRRDDVVDYVGPNGGGSLGLVGMYPTHFQPPLAMRGNSEELRRAAAEGRLKVTGIPTIGTRVRAAIPAEDWLQLRIYSDKVSQLSEDRSRHVYPWRDVVLECSAMKKLWRTGHEVTGRSKFDWAAIRAVYEDLSASNPDMSQNELILELQGTFEERFKKEPPSRSTIQRNISTWS